MSERGGGVLEWLIHFFVIGRSWIQIPALKPAVLTKVPLDFSLYLPVNTGIP
jgi:hypothetical protein